MKKEDDVIDILYRYQDSKKLKETIDIIKKSTKNSFIMIDGEWGSGKTTLLKILKKDIIFTNNVVEYNCWANSFYPEPLIAIISSINDQLNHFRDIDRTTIEILKRYSIDMGINMSFKVNFFGFAISPLKKRKNQDYKSLEHYILDFKNGLTGFNSNNIRENNKGTTIILVDELDRCLPEYAIKVLERLYLLFKDVLNIIVIIACDKKQLENSIKKIYGNEYQASEYLKKFIDKYFLIENTKIDPYKLRLRFDDYFKMFDVKDDISILTIVGCFLYNMNIREIVQKFNDLIQKHLICFGDKKMSDYISVVEVMLAFISIEKMNGILMDIHKIENSISPIIYESVKDIKRLEFYLKKSLPWNYIPSKKITDPVEKALRVYFRIYYQYYKDSKDENIKKIINLIKDKYYFLLYFNNNNRGYYSKFYIFINE